MSAKGPWLLGALGLWLVGVPLAGWIVGPVLAPRAGGLDGASAQAGLDIELAPAHSPSGQALREARTEWIRAQMAAARELELAPEPSPDEAVRHVTDAHRQFLMTVDRTGALRRARLTARRAAVLARTPSELWRAAELLARLECDAGNHLAELRYARQMIALQPQQRASWETLKHAAVCNEDDRLIRLAEGSLHRTRVLPKDCHERNFRVRAASNGQSAAN